MQAQMKKWVELSQDNFVATQKWVDINTNLFTNLAQQQLNLMGIYAQSSNKQVQIWTQAKEVGEVVTAQTELLDDFRKQMMNNAHGTVDLLVDTKQQLNQWAEYNLKLMTHWNTVLNS